MIEKLEVTKNTTEEVAYITSDAMQQVYRVELGWDPAALSWWWSVTRITFQGREWVGTDYAPTRAECWQRVEILFRSLEDGSL